MGRKRPYAGGYASYRDGEKRPIYNPASQKPGRLPKQRIDHLIRSTTEILRDWQTTPFQNEASCRHGLRIGLVEDGLGWQASDDAAAYVVREGLLNLKAKRPTWAEGQPEYTDSPDLCVDCHKPLDDEQIANGDRFCSGVCARAYIQERDKLWKHTEDRLLWAAYRAVTISQRPKQLCPQCGKTFQRRGSATNRSSIYCSRRCGALAQRMHYDRECANPGCTKTFHPKVQAGGLQQYCSRECFDEHRRTKPAHIDMHCLLCARPFRARTPTSLFCSATCKNQFSAFKTGAIVPQRLAPKVFDFFVGQVWRTAA